MTTTTVALSALLPSKDNPRRSYDRRSIEGLASTIAIDGIIHNLTVRPEQKGKYRVVAGMRRYLALQHLLKKGSIERSYRVPVTIRKGASPQELIRLATVENVQREALDPIDEAESFAKLLRDGSKIDDVAAETGVSLPTIRRRLALADLCHEAKAAVREKKVSLSIAEALTLATPDQQKAWLKQIKPGSGIDAAYLRSALLAEKPSVAIALFPLEKYTGSLTKDLFADKETTYFDDREEFMRLQSEAVNELAEKHRKAAAWIDVVTDHVVQWWQYREAGKKEQGGVVIQFQPTGRVEVRKGLARHEVDQKSIEPVKAPARPKERAEWTVPTIRYANAHKSVAVQASLLGNPRRAKEATALLLLTSGQGLGRVELLTHASLEVLAEGHTASGAYDEINEISRRLVKALRIESQNGASTPPAWKQVFQSGTDCVELHGKLRKLSDPDLETLITLCVILSFGTGSLDRLDDDISAINRLGSELKVDLRAYWTPDAAFLQGLRRDQLSAIANETGAVLQLPRLPAMGKKELVEGLAAYFRETADPKAKFKEDEDKARRWVPTCMQFAFACKKNE